MKLMIVESPNKVKKIAAILGSEWSIMASSGHIRDLPKKEMGINEPDFQLKYEFIPPQAIPGARGKFYPGGKERVARIAKAAKEAEIIYLATDPDREGEAIAWHLMDALKLHNKNYQRVVFDAITPDVIKAAINKARKIDAALVHAQEARRALDRLVGYSVSPMLGKQLGMAVSAGRVQSPAVRIVVERERQIISFKETKHFGAVVSFDENTWSAEWNTKPFLQGDSEYILDEELAINASNCRNFTVKQSELVIVHEAPPPPFSTSTMLQAASVTLKLDPEKTAKIAQKLFEQGLITYHRTDSVNFSEEALVKMRQFIKEKNWPLPNNARRFKSKSDAQEAHEAIRPTHLEDEAAGEDEEQRNLYRLIWLRSIASQLVDAEYKINNLTLESIKIQQIFEFKAKGRLLTNPGWRILTMNDATDEEAGIGEGSNAETSGKVPLLEQNSKKMADTGKVLFKKTKPPTRYSKASLIKKLENEGIGRPSTYPAIMSNIVGKGYLTEQRRLLIPAQIGFDLVDALQKAKFSFIELSFTKKLEDDLDQIAAGKRTYLSVVRDANSILQKEITCLTSSEFCNNPSFSCSSCGKEMRRIKGKNGYFWGCTGYKDGCKHTLSDDKKPK